MTEGGVLYGVGPGVCCVTCRHCGSCYPGSVPPSSLVGKVRGIGSEVHCSLHSFAALPTMALLFDAYAISCFRRSFHTQRSLQLRCVETSTGLFLSEATLPRPLIWYSDLFLYFYDTVSCYAIWTVGCLSLTS